jgi:DNA-binding MarR family transcriptional regulator
MNEKTVKPNLPAVLHAAHAVQAEVEEKLSAVGLSGPKLQALRVLAEAGESLALTQLAGRLSCVKSNITQLVDRLEAEGLVARKSDPSDRRTKLAVLTAAGRKALKDGARVFEAAERQVFSRLSRDEAHTLYALLGKIEARDSG